MSSVVPSRLRRRHMRFGVERSSAFHHSTFDSSGGLQNMSYEITRVSTSKWRSSASRSGSMNSVAPTDEVSGATCATSLFHTSGVARKSTGTRSGLLVPQRGADAFARAHRPIFAAGG